VVADEGEDERGEPGGDDGGAEHGRGAAIRVRRATKWYRSYARRVAKCRMRSCLLYDSGRA
jgi:hypothetical protein